MKISSEVLFNLIDDQFKTIRYGKKSDFTNLPLPVFYNKNSQPTGGHVYICNSEEIPVFCNDSGIFICCGIKPQNISPSYKADVIFVNEEYIDLLTLFNSVQHYFEKIGSWHSKLDELLEMNTGVESLVEASIPIFENRITVTDYELRVIASCEINRSDVHKKVVMSKKYQRVPNNISKDFHKTFEESLKHREPFISTQIKGDSDKLVDNYCINLYIGNNYVGTCTLCEDSHPPKNSDYLLFQQFAEYVRKSLIYQNRFTTNDIVSMRSIFTNLLKGFPVSQNDIDSALRLVNVNLSLEKKNSNSWYCIIIKSANKDKSLPAKYICATIEEIFPRCFTIDFENYIIVYHLLASDETIYNNIDNYLSPYLKDMNFIASVSMPFESVYKAKKYFLQATMALDNHNKESCHNNNIHYFEDEVLNYMLSNCSGSLEPKMLLTPGLMYIRKHEGAVNYWETLKSYLDNECNASQTSQEMHLHRSTLLPRLKIIKRYVKMDTPEERLYLRMCIRMIEEYENDKNSIG